MSGFGELLGVLAVAALWFLMTARPLSKKSKGSSEMAQPSVHGQSVMKELKRMLDEAAGESAQNMEDAGRWAGKEAMDVEMSYAEDNAKPAYDNAVYEEVREEKTGLKDAREYYTYETAGIEEAQERVAEAVKRFSYEDESAIFSTADTVLKPVEESRGDREPFDLRKAFVYNAILQNKYIPELK